MKLTIPKLKAKLKGDGLCGAYLFYGEEKFILNSYTELIKSKTAAALPEFNYMEFDEEKCDYEQFSGFVMSYPVMSETKTAVVKNSGFLRDSARAKSIAELVCSMPEYLTVIFIEDGIAKVKKDVISAFESHGAMTEFVRQKPADLQLWVAKKLASGGRKISRPDAAELIGMCGCSLEKLNVECEKLIAAAQSEIIDRNLIDRLVVVPAEYKVFEMSDNLLNKQSDKAYRLLKEFKINKEQPTEILALIYAAVSDIYMFKVLPGAESFLAANRKWLAAKYRGLAQKSNAKDLRKIMKLCYDCDIKIKTGAVEPYTALELVMAEMVAC